MICNNAYDHIEQLASLYTFTAMNHRRTQAFNAK